MKHTHRIIRLLTLAVVSCALAALLSGCTKEEFIAGYNEFLFGDWFPSPPSAGETTAAPGKALMKGVPHRGTPVTSTPSPTPSATPRSRR